MPFKQLKMHIALSTACLLVAGCGANPVSVTSEISLDTGTTGLADEEVAKVLWEHGLYAIDDFHEHPHARVGSFYSRFARLVPGEHHFFMNDHHGKTHDEFNWVFGDLKAGHRYRVERADSSGFWRPRTRWVLRDLTAGVIIAESVDCHESTYSCGILDYLRRMHVQDREVRPISPAGDIGYRPPGSFGERYSPWFDSGLEQASLLDVIAMRIASALAESGLPINLEDSAASELVLEIRNVELSTHESVRFAAYDLDAGYQVFLACVASLVTKDGIEIDKWLVATIGESPASAIWNWSVRKKYDEAFEDAADRLSARLVYDLQRRLDGIPRQSVLSR